MEEKKHSGLEKEEHPTHGFAIEEKANNSQC